MPTFDLAIQTLRDLNQALHAIPDGSNDAVFEILNPRGSHAVAVGVDKPVTVDIRGPVGYYCAGMNDGGTVTVHGSAGPGVAENMMSGAVVVEGDASQYAGATGRGGLLVIKGNAASRCGISMKGVDIVVHGNVGHMSAFMGQSGYLRRARRRGRRAGRLALRSQSLRARQGQEPRRGLHREADAARACAEAWRAPRKAGVTGVKPQEFKRYGSARKLYNFNIDNADAY